MKTASVRVCLAILLSWTVTRPVSAQDVPGQASLDGEEGRTVDRFDHRNFLFRSDAGDGIGYAKGFQTFGAFQPIIISPDEFILFVNPRGFITYNSGDVGANVGAGFRSFDPGIQRILGGSFWYDHDNTGDRRYDQFGISLESLGQYFDVRVNGYMPTNDNRQFLGSFLTGTTSFVGNNIGFGQNTIFEVPLKGGDFELGGAFLPGFSDYGLRLYGGGYYYQGEDIDAAYGVKGRLEALVTQNLWAQVAVSHDRLFGTNVTAAATWYFGTGQAPRWFQRIPVVDRLYQQVERNYRISVFREEILSQILALRAGGTGGSGGPAGSPIFVLHVDNSAPAGGDGSAERPLNFLPTTTPSNVDIIFVRRGTGTSLNYDQGITLNNFQRLLGDGYPHLFTSQQGTFQLPGFSPGAFPVITNVNGDAVTLASFNEVAAFSITSPERHGVFGDGITDFNLHHLNITDAGFTTDPTGTGIRLLDATGNGLITDSAIARSAGGAIRIDNTGGDLNLLLRGDDIRDNTTVGVTMTATDGSLDLVADNNSFVRNEGVGLAYQLVDTATGTLAITNSIFQNQINDSTGNPIFNGQAIDIRLTGSVLLSNATATLTSGLIQNNTIGSDTNPALGNAGSGIVLFTEQRTTLSNLTINQNTIANNGVDGINVLRRNEAFLNNLVISNNLLTNNGDDGVDITARNTDFAVNTVTLRNNDISENGNRGVALRVESDAFLQVNMFDNVINNNTTDGIEYTEQVNSATDLRTLSGTWQRNIITENGGHGIELSGSTGGLLIGSAVSSADGNVINDNTLDGIEINGTGSVTIGSNDISSNGTGGIDINPQTFNNITITRNTITNNNGDAIEILDDGPFGVFVNINNNFIRDNTGRGIDILNRGPIAFTNVQISSNVITGSGLEGIYVVNTASPTQNQTNPATDPLNADGSIFATPVLFLTVNNNLVEGNGLNSPFNATGLVVRVGTTGGGYGFNDDGGFFGGRGGISASVTGNTFSGNFGDDVYFDSFTSTVNPAGSTGTWDATTFSVTAFQGDPLARLNLEFHNNSFDSTDVNNVGAFYNNAEATFKSRETGQTPAGPFASGARRRNAQRLAARFTLNPQLPDPPPPTGGILSGDFLYPGLGQSTFRLVGGTTIGDVIAGGFLTDDVPYVGPNSANGEPFPGAQFGELPFGWTFDPTNANPPRPQ